MVEIESIESNKRGVAVKGTEGDILSFINEFGFCEIRQIMKRFAMKKSRAYLHMQILTRLGLIVHLRILQNRPGVYCLTQKGIRLLDLDLPPLGKIPTSIYDHQLMVINVHLKLREVYPDAAWMSERRLIREKYADGVPKKEHLPDGVLVFPDTRQCAIEVERSLKSRARLEEIMLGYALQRSFKEVWYFCSPFIFPVMKEVASDMPFVKVANLEEFLS